MYKMFHKIVSRARFEDLMTVWVQDSYLLECEIVSLGMCFTMFRKLVALPFSGF